MRNRKVRKSLKGGNIKKHSNRRRAFKKRPRTVTKGKVTPGTGTLVYNGSSNNGSSNNGSSNNGKSLYVDLKKILERKTKKNLKGGSNSTNKLCDNFEILYNTTESYLEENPDKIYVKKNADGEINCEEFAYIDEQDKAHMINENGKDLGEIKVEEIKENYTKLYESIHEDTSENTSERKPKTKKRKGLIQYFRDLKEKRREKRRDKRIERMCKIEEIRQAHLTEATNFEDLKGLDGKNPNKKNRYANIFSSSNSMKPLIRGLTDSEDSSKCLDYFNGSLFEFKDYDNLKYIATQCPIESSFKDFWNVVWGQNIDRIVMVTQHKEGVSQKCHNYYPENIGDSEDYGNIEVTLASKDDLVSDGTKYGILRMFTVKKDDEERDIKHYQYTEWPDHGVPLKEDRKTFDTDAFIDFINEVGSNNKEIPILVHCSAGVGRTGTFIISHLLKNNLENINDFTYDKIKTKVLELIDIMRKDRTQIVQTKAQFDFIVETIQNIQNPQSSQITSDLDNYSVEDESAPPRPPKPLKFRTPAYDGASHSEMTDPETGDHDNDSDFDI